VLFCVIDKGLDTSHPDLASDKLTITSCQASESGPCFPMNDDTTGQGTHVVGTIAVIRNGVGVVGVAAEGARIHVYNAFGPSNTFRLSDEVLAYQDCRRKFRGSRSDSRSDSAVEATR
jgi:subtilisin family serine protease